MKKFSTSSKKKKTKNGSQYDFEKKFELNPKFSEDRKRIISYFDAKSVEMPRYFYRLTNELKNKYTTGKVYAQVDWYLRKGLTIEQIKTKWLNRPKALAEKALKDMTPTIPREEWITIISTPMRD